jgi:ABC-type antimicrobial peptide transport system permease subunit
VYAIAAFSIGSRTRELAVRSAFGARRGVLVALVLGEELRPVVFGLLIGLTGAVAAARLFRDLVFGIAPTDPSTYLGVAVALTALTTVAVYVPVRRVASIDPAAILRG